VGYQTCSAYEQSTLAKVSVNSRCPGDEVRQVPRVIIGESMVRVDIAS
jgi:hypothetical protein